MRYCSVRSSWICWNLVLEGMSQKESSEKEEKYDILSLQCALWKHSHFWEKHQDLQLFSTLPCGICELPWMEESSSCRNLCGFALDGVMVVQQLCLTAATVLLCTNKNCLLIGWLANWVYLANLFSLGVELPSQSWILMLMKVYLRTDLVPLAALL